MGLPTVLGVLVVLIVGGGLVLTTNQLSWHSYEQDAAVLIGLLGIGHGIDSHSRP